MDHAVAITPEFGLPRRPTFRKSSIIPGFGLTFGFTLAWLCLIVLIPLSAVFIKSAGMGWSDFVAIGFSGRALAAYRLSFGAAVVSLAGETLWPSTASSLAPPAVRTRSLRGSSSASV